MNSTDIQFLFATLQRANPHPASELLYSSTFELLAAVLLSAQATDASVNRATRRLFALAPTPQAMLALGEAALCDHIRSIGLYRTKAKHLIQACRILVEHHGGQVPRERVALQALPGVGRKTANVVLNVAFGEPTMAVDTHVFRVANRTGLAPGSTPEAVEEGLLAAVPEPYRIEAHHWLILHGRYVCTARLPDCRACAIQGVCAAFAASGGAATLQ
jgi:endonuclease-3